jgi:hypothetical protein
MAVALLLESRAVSAAPNGLAATVSSAALSAPAASATVVGLLQLMSTSKLVLGAAILGAVFTVAVATREVRADLQGADSLANAERQNAALLARSNVVAREVAAVTRERNSLRASVAALRAEKDRQAAADLADGVVDSEAAGQEFVSAHPEAVTLVTNAIRANLLKSYGPFFQSRHLTSAQIDAFVDLRLRGGEGGLRWNTQRQAPVAEFSLGDLTSAEREDGLRRLFGDEGYREYLDFGRQDPARTLTSEMGRALYFTATPLTSEQAGQLTQLFVQNSARYREGKTIDLAAVDWAAALEQAQAFLAPAQLSALRENYAQRQVSQALRNGVRVVQQAAEAKNAPASAAK